MKNLIFIIMLQIFCNYQEKLAGLKAFIQTHSYHVFFPNNDNDDINRLLMLSYVNACLNRRAENLSSENPQPEDQDFLKKVIGDLERQGSVNRRGSIAYKVFTLREIMFDINCQMFLFTLRQKLLSDNVCFGLMFISELNSLLTDYNLGMSGISDMSIYMSICMSICMSIYIEEINASLRREEKSSDICCCAFGKVNGVTVRVPKIVVKRAKGQFDHVPNFFEGLNFEDPKFFENPDFANFFSF